MWFSIPQYQSKFVFHKLSPYTSFENAAKNHTAKSLLFILSTNYEQKKLTNSHKSLEDKTRIIVK